MTILSKPEYQQPEALDRKLRGFPSHQGLTIYSPMTYYKELLRLRPEFKNKNIAVILLLVVTEPIVMIFYLKIDNFI